MRQLSPLLLYFRSWFLYCSGREEEALQVAMQAENCVADDFFPNSPEALQALECVTGFALSTPKAYYLLGNLWYDKRQYPEAIAAWERSMELDNRFPTVLRNLALGYYNKLGREEEAVGLLEQAFRLDETDARC